MKPWHTRLDNTIYRWMGGLFVLTIVEFFVG
jgi:hypothetical protein